jgi:hypothetical protein
MMGEVWLGGEGRENRDRYADSGADESLPQREYPGRLGSPRAEVAQPRHRLPKEVASLCVVFLGLQVAHFLTQGFRNLQAVNS